MKMLYVSSEKPRTSRRAFHLDPFLVSPLLGAPVPVPVPAPGARRTHQTPSAPSIDDALGEELQVIWEIEPGARAFEKTEPKGFDQPGHLSSSTRSAGAPPRSRP